VKIIGGIRPSLVLPDFLQTQCDIVRHTTNNYKGPLGGDHVLIAGNEPQWSRTSGDLLARHARPQDAPDTSVALEYVSHANPTVA
jgi:hypothetical protein